MSMPAFFSRVADSLRRVAEVDPETLAAKLEGVRVHIHLFSSDQAASRAYELAVNLASRLYPRIDLSTASTHPELAERARDQVLAINPGADVRVHAATVDDTSPIATDVDAGVFVHLNLGTPAGFPDQTQWVDSASASDGAT